MEEKDYLIEVPISGTRVITIKGTSPENALERALNQKSEVIDEFDVITLEDKVKADIIVSEYSQEYFDKKYGDSDFEY